MRESLHDVERLAERRQQIGAAGDSSGNGGGAVAPEYSVEILKF